MQSFVILRRSSLVYWVGAGVSTRVSKVKTRASRARVSRDPISLDVRVLFLGLTDCSGL